MLKVKPFRALRPSPELADKVSSLPYDVMNTKEAAQMACGNEVSFLHVIRSEIDLPESTDPHAPEVYAKAAENLESFINRGVLIKDQKPHYYIYRQIMNGRVQTGICALVSIDDYQNGLIKRHEFTLPEKEVDRIHNFLACKAHTEPVFLINKKDEVIKKVIQEVTASNEPVYSFTSDDGIAHALWLVETQQDSDALQVAFQQMDALYIADVHHRTASSCRVGEKMRAEQAAYDPEAEFNYIMAVIFSEDELHIMDYNRLLNDLGDYTEDTFLNALQTDFNVLPILNNTDIKANAKHHFSMYLAGKWYQIIAKDGTFDADDPVASLDASILQKNLFSKLLDIEDPRTTKRLSFVGGIRGYSELKNRVDKGEAAAAFALYPVRISDLLAVADSGMVMPPKSTWFEPKLRSGLFIHQF